MISGPARVRPGVSVFALALFVAGGAAVSACGSKGAAVTQPLPFNHKAHIDQQVECVFCHERVTKDSQATLPNLAVCMGCHSEPKGNSPIEPKVREYDAAKKEIPWIRVNRLVGHVYFSHRAHVKWGAIDCSTCHGDMKTRTVPVTESQIGGLTMTRCIECHKEKGARTDCLTCHK
jgi:cytochrome c553